MTCAKSDPFDPDMQIDPIAFQPCTNLANDDIDDGPNNDYVAINHYIKCASVLFVYHLHIGIKLFYRQYIRYSLIWHNCIAT